MGFSGVLCVFWLQQSRGLVRVIWCYVLALGHFGGLVGVSGGYWGQLPGYDFGL